MPNCSMLVSSGAFDDVAHCTVTVGDAVNATAALHGVGVGAYASQPDADSVTSHLHSSSVPHGVREVDTPIAAARAAARRDGGWLNHHAEHASTDVDMLTACGVGAALAGSPGVMLTTRLPLVSIGTSGAIGRKARSHARAATLNAVGATEPYAPCICQVPRDAARARSTRRRPPVP